MSDKLIGKFFDKSDDTFWVKVENDVVRVIWRDDRRCVESEINLWPEDAAKLAELLNKVKAVVVDS